VEQSQNFGGYLSTTASIQHCVACGSQNCDREEEWNGYELKKCGECGLSFTANPDYNISRYVQSYERENDDSNVPLEFRKLYSIPERRLRLEAMAFRLPFPYLTPSERFALQWLTGNIARGSVVIDCGCGVGRFLRAMKREEFLGVGVEASEVLISLLRQNALEAVQGLAPDFPYHGEAPSAITFFEVLEHIPNPLNVILSLKDRFPNAVVLASVPSPLRPDIVLYGQRGAGDFPPHHFLRWTPKALEAFFCKAGYSNVFVNLLPPKGSEVMPGFGQVFGKHAANNTTPSADSTITSIQKQPTFSKRLKATTVVWVHKGYQMTMNLVGSPKAWQAHRKGVTSAGMLVIAKP
jgi:2-polyprenyl-3-methyl-5-hydroxy-6-metoxy-1,4-benzoquinol methylase